MKVERLFRLGKLSRSCDLESVMKDEGSYKKFISELKRLSSEDDISFLEWKMVDKDEHNKRTKSKTKLSCKVSIVKKFNEFISDLKRNVMLLSIMRNSYLRHQQSQDL